MAFTEEGNFLLKDKIIRSDFRLVDVEIRVGAFRSPNRVSALLQSRLAGQVAQEGQIEQQVLPPGNFGLEGFGGGPIGTPGGPMDGSAVPPGQATEILGKQVYTVRGETPAFGVYRTAPITSDGILVRVYGEMTSVNDVIGVDNGIVFLISDNEQTRSVARAGGDYDLMVTGTGSPPPGRHGVGLIFRATSSGFGSQSVFDVGFHTAVRTGRRFAVEHGMSGVGDFWAVFEVAQFIGVGASSGYIGNRIRESVPPEPAPTGFIPVVMQESIRRPGGRVVESLAEVNQLLMLGWIIVGNLDPQFGVFAT